MRRQIEGNTTSEKKRKALVRCDVVLDESASWYLPSPPTPDNSIMISKDEVSEAEIPLEKGHIGNLEESPISFRLSGPNERLS